MQTAGRHHRKDNLIPGALKSFSEAAKNQGTTQNQITAAKKRLQQQLYFAGASYQVILMMVPAMLGWMTLVWAQVRGFFVGPDLSSKLV